MQTLEEIKQELDRLYFLDPKHYLYRLQKYKEAGYRILRNSAGKHKVNATMEQMFGGTMFENIFNGFQ